MKITSLFGRNLPAAAGPLAPRIATELDARTAELAELERTRGALALAVATGETEAPAKMAAYRARVTELQATVADLRAAHGAALAADNETDAKRRLAIHASRVASLRQHLATREKAALRLGAAIENCAVEWSNLLAANTKIAALLDFDGAWPADALITFASIKAAVAGEMLRVGHGPQSGDGFPAALPGARASTLDARGNPDGLTSLAARIKQASAWLLAQIGAAASAAPMPLAAPAAPADPPLAEAAAEPPQPDPDAPRRLPSLAELNAETLATGERVVLASVPLPPVRLNPVGGVRL